MRKNPDNKSFFSEKRKIWAYGLFATACLFFLSCGSPSGGQENKNQVPPVPNPTPNLVEYTTTVMTAVLNTRESETPVAVGTPVPVMHPEPPVTEVP